MQISDTQILSAINDNINRGFALLVKGYTQPLYWHIRRITVDHHDAEDALQETFLRAFKNIDTLHDDGSLKAWLYKIATNEALRVVQKRKDSGVDVAEILNEPTADNYIDYSDAEAVLLQKAIHTLPPKQQATFGMRYFDDMTYDQIALATDTSPSNAKTNYHLAKNKVSQYIKDNAPAI